eukprot:3712803-Lingulodinium_polyedra.AAC.1
MSAACVMIGGKRVPVCGYGDAGEGGALATPTVGGNELITEIGPIGAPPARLEGSRLVTLESAAGGIDMLTKSKPHY